MQRLQRRPEGRDKSDEKVPQPVVVERGSIRQPKTWGRWSHAKRTHHPRILGFQCWGVSKEKHRLGLVKSKKASTRWTKGEIDFLKANWNKIETRELSRILGKSPQSIYHKKHRLGLVRNIKVDWSKRECIAYVLGALWGDGNVEYYPKRSVYRVVLRVKDKNFAMRFFDELKNMNLNPYISCQGDGRWKVQTYSKELATYLKSLGISNARELRGEKAKSAFLAGLFDAEGSIGLAKGTLQFRIFNTDKELIDLASGLSKELGFDLTRSERRLPSGKTYFTLSLCNKQSINSFLSKISPTRCV